MKNSRLLLSTVLNVSFNDAMANLVTEIMSPFPLLRCNKQHRILCHGNHWHTNYNPSQKHRDNFQNSKPNTSLPPPPPHSPMQCCYVAVFLYSPIDFSGFQHCLGEERNASGTRPARNAFAGRVLDAFRTRSERVLDAFWTRSGRVVEELLEFKCLYLLALELNRENIKSRCVDV